MRRYQGLVRTTASVSGRTRAGFSLLEVIIATAILAGSAVLLASMISSGANLVNRAQQRAEALLVAQSVIDETISLRDGEIFEEEATAGTPEAWGYRVVTTADETRGMILVVVDVAALDESQGSVSDFDTEAIVHLVRSYRPRTPPASLAEGEGL